MSNNNKSISRNTIQGAGARGLNSIPHSVFNSHIAPALSARNLLSFRASSKITERLFNAHAKSRIKAKVESYQRKMKFRNNMEFINARIDLLRLNWKSILGNGAGAINQHVFLDTPPNYDPSNRGIILAHGGPLHQQTNRSSVSLTQDFTQNEMLSLMVAIQNGALSFVQELQIITPMSEAVREALILALNVGAMPKLHRLQVHGLKKINTYGQVGYDAMFEALYHRVRHVVFTGKHAYDFDGVLRPLLQPKSNVSSLIIMDTNPYNMSSNVDRFITMLCDTPNTNNLTWLSLRATRLRDVDLAVLAVRGPLPSLSKLKFLDVTDNRQITSRGESDLRIILHQTPSLEKIHVGNGGRYKFMTRAKQARAASVRKRSRNNPYARAS